MCNMKTDELFTLHVWAGYLVGGLLVFRILGALLAMSTRGFLIFYVALPSRLPTLKT